MSDEQSSGIGGGDSGGDRDHDSDAWSAGAVPGPGPDPAAGTRAGGQAEASAGPGPGQGPDPLRAPLRRDRRSRMIAGVCGGLGRHLDVDPIVFRILFAVLTFFGGFGLLAYATAWLFVPCDGEDESEAHRLLTGRSALGAVAVAVLMALGFMAALTTLSRGFDHAVPLLVIASVIVLVLVWRGDASRGARAGTAQYAGPGRQGAAAPRPWWQRPVAAQAAPDLQAPGLQAPGPVGREAGAADAGARTTSAGTLPAYDPSLLSGREPAGEPRQRRLSGLALSAALLLLGLLGVLGKAGVFHIGVTSGVAVAVMAVGAGMVVGGLFGRARALIPLGLVLAVPLILANAVGMPLRGETGHVFWTPVSAAALASPYDAAVGHGELDLSAIDPRGGAVHVRAYVGVGQLRVTVPDDVAVEITAHVGAGHILFPDDSEHNGIDLTDGFAEPALAGSHGTIVLDIKVGMGSLEVDRA
ncbi:PspC domain-containing protein [Actinocrinis puniceicyclus]|uniref:PspC domain-containing protein n=1 Tax=Actinocrinis puniceicyclus TaxID=977794 RepID=A0A8J7WKY8_9ACTN|nr:PspC domain-containing protein [Actinocrinis puniceicyclus]MBS2961709.1 PspC domain-containing protein [Actinocrinis puniceicyclus]